MIEFIADHTQSFGIGRLSDRMKLIWDELSSPMIAVITILGFGIPVVTYFSVIHRYGVNVLVADQLSTMTVIKDSYSAHFQWGPLWAQHNNDRLFFPNLIAIVLAHTVSFNVVVEEYLSAIMLVATTALLILAHKRRSPETPWLYYVPVVFLMFSISQYFNTLWGFQLCWYLILLSLAVALWLLDGLVPRWVPFIGAIAAGVVGSYSSFEGLLIWPAGLVILYHRRRAARFVVVWFGAAVATVVLYFHDFNTRTAAPKPHYAIDHPLASLKFYLALVGYVARFAVKVGHSNSVEVLFGLVIVALALGVVLIYGLHRDDQTARPLGVALICFGLLFAGAVTQGRVTKGYVVAGASRFTSFDLLILVGIYLALVARPTKGLLSNRAPQTDTGEVEQVVPDALTGVRGLIRLNARAVHSVVLVIVLLVIAAQVVTSSNTGLLQSQATHMRQERAAIALEHLDSTPNSALPGLALAPHKPALYLRQQIEIARDLHLSLFADADRNTS